MNFRKFFFFVSLFLMFFFTPFSNAEVSKPDVSVVIPVYNTAKWLPQCLDSLTNQTLKDIEIICVDDGSTDGSGAVLDDYAKKDSRITVVHLRKNCGVSTARNVGLDLCKGEYIAFVDSDDYVHPLTYEYALKYVKEDDNDCIYFQVKYFTDGKDDFDVNNIDTSDRRSMSIEEYLQNISEEFHVVGFLYKRSVIQGNSNNPIRFVPEISQGEDDCFVFCFLLVRCKKIKVIPAKFYQYRLGRAGQAISLPIDKLDDSTGRRKIPKIVCDFWRSENALKGREHLLLSLLVRWLRWLNPGYLKYSEEFLNSFGPDIYNKDVIKKCPRDVRNTINKMENHVRKSKK